MMWSLILAGHLTLRSLLACTAGTNSTMLKTLQACT
jgi:hypothetical protein